MATADIIPEIWSARITYYTSAYSAYIPQTNREYEGDATMGNKVHVPTVDRDVTVNTYSRTANLAAPESIVPTAQELDIDQEEYFHFAYEDLDARQARIDASTIIDNKAEGAGIAISQEVDQFVCSKMNGITSGNLLKNNSAANFDLKYLNDVKLQANLINLPYQGIVVVCTPEHWKKVEDGVVDGTYGDILTAANFVNGLGNDPNEGGSPMGYVGMLNGIRHYVSNRIEMRTLSSNTTPLTSNASNRGGRSIAYAFDPRDLALVVQVNKTEVYRPELRFATAVKGLINYGAKVLNEGRVQKFIFND